MRASSSFYLLALLATTTSTFAAPIASRDLATVETSKSGSVGVLDTSCPQCAGSPNDQSADVPGVASVDTDKTADVAALDTQVLPLATSEDDPSSEDSDLANLSAPIKALGPVPEAVEETITPTATSSSDDDSFDLYKAINKLLGLGSEAPSDQEKTAIFRAIKTYLANGGLIPSDDTLAGMGFSPRFRKAFKTFLASGSPSDFPTAEDLNDSSASTSSTSDDASPDLLKPVSAIASAASPDSESDAASDDADAASKKPVKLVLRPFTAREDQIPEGTIACPDQDPAAPLGAHLEGLIPRVLNLCLDTTTSFVTPAAAAVCPEDREVFLGVHAKSQVGEGEEVKEVTGGKGPVVRLCEEASVPNP